MVQNDILISPSILSADVMNLSKEVQTIAREADLIHVDVMDGEFVPNLSFGPNVVRGLKREFDIPLDVHLMIEHPDIRAINYARAGADLITFHYEAAKHPHRLVEELRQAGAMVGVAINPGTPAWSLEGLMNIVDMVLVMSVEPGFSGQSFIDYTYDKVRRLRSMANALSKRTRIEVDGGVTRSNAGSLSAAGADILVAGSAVFDTRDRGMEIRAIRESARRGLSRTDR